MNKRRILALACAGLALLTVLFSGCGTRMNTADAPTPPLRTPTQDIADNFLSLYGNVTGTTTARNLADYMKKGASEISEEPGRYFVANAQMEIQTKTYDAFSSGLKATLKALGGYTQGYEEYNYDTRSASITVRVPAAKLTAFMESLKENGTVVSENVVYADVTDEMIETGSRKKALEAEEAALLAILEKAKTVEDIITVQDRISRVRGDLESYLQKLQKLSGEVEYSTVQISVREVSRISALKQSFGALASAGFLSSVKGIGAGLRGFAIWFIGAIPYLALLAAMIVPLALLLKRRKTKKAAKRV